MKQKKLSFLPFAAVIIIFASLLAALLSQREALPGNRIISLSFGLLAFSVVLTQVLISLRPKFLERKIGLPAIYKTHGKLAFGLILASIVHAAIMEVTKGNETALTTAGLSGSLSLLLLLLISLTGMFVLSSSYISKFPFVKRLKIHTLKRETGLWIHRLSKLAVLVIFAHMMLTEYIRANPVLFALSILYVALVMGAVLTTRVARQRLPKYVLQNCVQTNEKVFELEFMLPKGTIMSYQAGQFVFIRFLVSDVPDESHPFSISSAPTQGGSIKVLIKNCGDYTSTMKLLKKGDIATLEGPYGNFADERIANANTPLVMLAGGIGITPILSILRSQMVTQPTRRIVLVWALSQKNDLLMIDELQNMQQANPNFSYHITLSSEQVEDFDYGRISQDYLQRIKVNTLYSEADFYICGPPPMMSVVKSIILDNQVKPENIHVEEFSF